MRKHKGVSYAKWGYIFILPFFVVYILFTLIPQLTTFYNAFFENYRSGLKQIGPNFVGFDNFVKLFTPDKTGSIDMLKYFGNTIILWVMGAVPQVAVALLLAVFFTSYRLNIKGQQFFKTVIYMPNLIMASAFSMLFFTLFSPVGPVNQILLSSGWADKAIDFLGIRISVRILISLMNFLMWFGNTTILLMAGIQGIDQNMFEAAEIDGANSLQVFFRVTLPLLAPILNWNTLVTGYVETKLLKEIRPNQEMGLVVDKLTQRLYVFLEGKLYSTLLVSTGLSLFVYNSLSSQYKDTSRKRDQI